MFDASNLAFASVSCGFATAAVGAWNLVAVIAHFLASVWIGSNAVAAVVVLVKSVVCVVATKPPQSSGCVVEVAPIVENVGFVVSSTYVVATVNLLQTAAVAAETRALSFVAVGTSFEVVAAVVAVLAVQDAPVAAVESLKGAAVKVASSIAPRLDVAVNAACSVSSVEVFVAVASIAIVTTVHVAATAESPFVVSRAFAATEESLVHVSFVAVTAEIDADVTATTVAATAVGACVPLEEDSLVDFFVVDVRFGAWDVVAAVGLAAEDESVLPKLVVGEVVLVGVGPRFAVVFEIVW